MIILLGLVKVERHGKAAVLTAEQFSLLLEEAPSARYRTL